MSVVYFCLTIADERGWISSEKEKENSPAEQPALRDVDWV